MFSGTPQIMSRLLAMTVSRTSSSSPVNAILVIARANPSACCTVAFGGTARTFGSVTTSTRAGPLDASACSSAGADLRGVLDPQAHQADGLRERGEVGVLQLEP